MKFPTFFTFIKAGDENNGMKIPIAFTKSMNEPLPEEVFLRDRNDRVWTVKVAKNGKRWSFVDGWDKFFKDNSMAPMDLLVFFHIRNNVFNVKLYGTCATEKNYISGPSRTRDVGTTSYVQISDDEEAGEDDDSDDDDETIGSDNDDNDEAIGSENNVHNLALVVHVNNDGNSDNNRPQGKPAPSLYPKCYGMENFQAGLAERPQGPYFVAKLMPKRIYNLFIPTYVIKDYSLALDDEITLVDPEGREFPSICKQWRDGRFLVSGGWRRLCGVNEVTQQHKYICEFMRREGDHRQFLYISFVLHVI